MAHHGAPQVAFFFGVPLIGFFLAVYCTRRWRWLCYGFSITTSCEFMLTTLPAGTYLCSCYRKSSMTQMTRNAGIAVRRRTTLAASRPGNPMHRSTWHGAGTTYQRFIFCPIFLFFYPNYQLVFSFSVFFYFFFLFLRCFCRILLFLFSFRFSKKLRTQKIFKF
jgi:hypothetical protein